MKNNIVTMQTTTNYSRFKIAVCLIVFVYTLHSCTINKEKYIQENLCKENNKFIVDTCKGGNGYATHGNAMALGYSSLCIPSDSFRFRIEFSKNGVWKLLEYLYYKNFEEIKIYTLEYDLKSGFPNFNPQKDSILNNAIKYNSKKKCDIFFGTLKELDILNLPEQKNIPNYVLTDYSTNFFIEYSNKCFYSSLEYENIDINSKRIKEAKRLKEFILMLNKEFNFSAPIN